MLDSLGVEVFTIEMQLGKDLVKSDIMREPVAFKKIDPNKLIERFKVMKIEQDPNQKDRVLLDIHITPYFPAKSFVIQLAGHKGDNPEDAIWESEYHQE